MLIGSELRLQWRLIASIGLLAAVIGAELIGSAAVIDWPHLKLTAVSSNVAWPNAIANAGDGTDRLYVARGDGVVQVLTNGTFLGEPFLDISERVIYYPDHGLLGLAFPPGYATKQEFYVYYTRRVDGAAVVSRFRVPTGSPVASPVTEEVLLVISDPRWGYYNGQLAFGPDGYLYVSRAIGQPIYGQDLSNLYGKILRIDVALATNGYTVPPDNPLLTNSAARPEIWLWGLRDARRFTFDRVTGDLYVCDRGDALNEEINFFNSTHEGYRNFGYPEPEYHPEVETYEQFRSIPPIMARPWGSMEQITGGYVSRAAFASRLNGIYFWGGEGFPGLSGLVRDGTNWLSMDFPEVAMSAYTFGEDEAGRLYVSSRTGPIYRIEDSGKARPPVPFPGNGIAYTDIIKLTSSNPGARIRYTVDGRDPADGDPEIESGQTVVVAPGSTLKAQALRDDLLPSDVSAATYTFKVASPVFTPAPGPVPNPTPVSIASVTPGAVIRYTTNGTQPTLSSALYSAPIVVTGNQVLLARAYRPGFENSELNAATYTWAIAAAPTFGPTAGPITNGTEVRISCSTPGANIRYTLDGSEPTRWSSKYTPPLRVNGNTWLKAKAFANGYQRSQTTSVFFDLARAASPVFTPPGGIVTNGTAVRITSITPGAVIRYTTNGGNPTISSAIYTKAIKVYADTTIKARAYTSDLKPSVIASASFQLVKAATPVVSPAQGPFTTAGSPVVITCATPGAKIRYTLDGSEPLRSSSLYSNALHLHAPLTLTARAFAPGHNPSDITTNFFSLADHEPTLVQTYAGNGQPGPVDGPGAHARLNSPKALCIDQYGTIFVADTGNHVIRKIDPNGNVTTIAGSGLAASTDGMGTNASFNLPTGIAVDPAGNLYVAEHDGDRISKITADRMVATVKRKIQGEGYYSYLWQLERDSAGLLYAGSLGSIVSITESGVASNIVGSFIPCPPYCPGRGLPPLPAVGLDRRDTVYWSIDVRLFRVDGSGQQIIAGSNSGYCDGPALQGCFTALSDVTIGDDDTIYIADANRIRMMNTNAYLSTLAGNGTVGYRNGASAVAQFNAVAGICVASNGVVYVADTGNHVIRKISFDRDRDGVPDPEEREPLQVGNDDRLMDSDGDGVSNADEYWAGSDPNNPNSTLKLHARPITGSQMAIEWPTAPGRRYAISASSNLIDWSLIISNVPGDGAVKTHTNTINAVPRAFYRLRVDPD